MGESKVKSSSKLLNLLLIILGLLFIFRAILDFLLWAEILVPEFLEDLSSEELSVFGSQGLISIALGFWSIVSGIGMFEEEEWAMGQAFVILSIMVISSISSIISWIRHPDTFDVEYWPNYIMILAFIVGVIGFIWLLLTRKRFD
jgi:hypothetical protein